VRELTADELLESLQTSLEAPEDARTVINRWLARGDGVAVYEHSELGHPSAGHRQYVSFGSPEAQLPDAFPPARMPDIGQSINWRYQLVGTYRGTPLK
jgi:hypothetical protein